MHECGLGVNTIDSYVCKNSLGKDLLLAVSVAEDEYWPRFSVCCGLNRYQDGTKSVKERRVHRTILAFWREVKDEKLAICEKLETRLLIHNRKLTSSDGAASKIGGKRGGNR
jgi:hypothetical protein